MRSSSRCSCATFVIQAFRIPSESMCDTLLVGDFLFVNKLEYGPKIPFTHIRAAGPARAAARRRDRVRLAARSEQGLHQALRRRRRPDGRDQAQGAEVDGVRAVEPYVKHDIWSEEPAGYTPRDNYRPPTVPPGRAVHDGRQPRQLERQPVLGHGAASTWSRATRCSSTSRPAAPVVERDVPHPLRAPDQGHPLMRRTRTRPARSRPTDPATARATRRGSRFTCTCRSVPRRCPYCHFSNEHLSGTAVDRWLGALEREAGAAAPHAAGQRFSSVFFGGGTPSAISPRHFLRAWRASLRSSRSRRAPRSRSRPIPRR